MRTRISTITQLKELFVEALVNHTSKVTKISDGSVLNGTAFGVAKVAQKAQKDIALIESRLFPSTAFGVYLDDVASELGIADRFGATGSSTYLLLAGDVGTTYVAGTQQFSGSGNITFELVDTVTIPVQGYAYALVRSVTVGTRTNVDALTINKVSPSPTGHKYVTNEFGATGGADAETDEDFRLRIRDTPNIVATDTLGRLTQVFIKINPKVMRLFYYGISAAGQSVIGVLTQNGAPLSTPEINDLLLKSSSYLSISDLRPFGSNSYAISIVNIDWYPVDIDFRVNLHTSADPDTVRRDAQIAISKKLDYRTWTPVDIVSWVDLRNIVQNTDGVKYCPDTYFTPRVDIAIANTQLPRVRSFIMRDMDGVMISDGGNTLNPTYFPSKVNTSYQATVLVTI